MSLKEYHRKRKFNSTPEPRGKTPKRGGKRDLLRFVIQMHEASRLHYDFRLEMGGVFKSWAVPKGPSLNPLDQRLAVFVEDHPLEYGKFEGVIPRGNYGAGTVMIWDEGTYIERGSTARADSEAAMLRGLANGHLTFVIEGQKLRGEFALIKLKGGSRRFGSADDKAWLLVKKRDEFASYRDITRENLSVTTGRSIREIAAQAVKAGDVWLPKRKAHATKPARATKAAPERAPIRAASSRALPAVPSLATRTPLPRRLKAMMPVQARTPPEGVGWVFDALGGGTRALCEIERGRVRLYSRQLLPLERKYPALVTALGEVRPDLVLDGEISRDGTFHAFDLLYLDGRDLRDEPLAQRKEALDKLRIFSGPIARSASATDWATLHRAHPEATEGLAREAKSVYRSGISRAWVRFPAAADGVKKGAASSPAPVHTNLDKVYWPKERYTKGDVIEYYRSIAPMILPHLRDRPQSLHRHPDGIAKPGFFQKDMTGFLPRWVKTQRIYSPTQDKSIDYFLCQDETALLYLANLGCIELNPWLSRIQDLDRPDFAVIDLDPDRQTFPEVMRIARMVRELLEEIEVEAYPKTSGSTGLHIAIPMGARYEYDAVREFSEEICREVNARLPAVTTVERTPARRRGKLYLDFLQNRRGQTLAAPYCLRPRPAAPVSMPLQWKELTARLRPEQFTIKNALRRVDRVGDLWKPVMGQGIDLVEARRRLAKIRDA